MTKGYQTSEFWLTGAVIVANIAAMAAGILPPAYAAIATALSAGLYAAARAYTKAGGTQFVGEPMELRSTEATEAELTAKIEAILAKRN